jgi:hypothetical protein
VNGIIIIISYLSRKNYHLNQNPKADNNMKTRRTFIKQSLLGAGALMTIPSLRSPELSDPDVKISLAEWSFHRALETGKMDHLDFPSRAKNEFGISAVEYVNGF